MPKSKIWGFKFGANKEEGRKRGGIKTGRGLAKPQKKTKKMGAKPPKLT